MPTIRGVQSLNAVGGTQDILSQAMMPYQPPNPVCVNKGVGGLIVGSGESFQIDGNGNLGMAKSDYSPETLANMVRMRLRSKPESYFEHWHFHKTLRKGEQLVIGIIVQDGVVTVLEDAWGLFPSDQLITQLRLLEK